jgi:hypothetical protein
MKPARPPHLAKRARRLVEASSVPLNGNRVSGRAILVSVRQSAVSAGQTRERS